MSNKILVTGGTGFIGSHTVVELYNAGYTPVIVDDLSNSSIKILDQIEKIIGYKPEFHQFDLCDVIRRPSTFPKVCTSTTIPPRHRFKNPFTMSKIGDAG